jgi:hypothetical protein
LELELTTVAGGKSLPKDILEFANSEWISNSHKMGGLELKKGEKLFCEQCYVVLRAENLEDKPLKARMIVS